MDFGRVLEGFREAKILDFRLFFDVFSHKNLECNLEGQKFEKNCQQEASGNFLKNFLRSVRAWGEGFRMGGSLPKSEISSLTLR